MLIDLLGYLGILFCVLGGALRFFDIYNITYKKKGKLHFTHLKYPPIFTFTSKVSSVTLNLPFQIVAI
jgi:hypothetical protein